MFRGVRFEDQRGVRFRDPTRDKLWNPSWVEWQIQHEVGLQVPSYFSACSEWFASFPCLQNLAFEVSSRFERATGSQN